MSMAGSRSACLLPLPLGEGRGEGAPHSHVVPAIGQIASFRRVVTQEDFDRFAALSGDDNPIHVDPAFCATTRFGRTLAHGMFLYGILCGVIARSFPNAILIEQELRFPGPTFAGDELTISIEVVAIDAGQRARLRAVVTTAAGATSCEGQTLVQLSESAGHV
jgi:acyl dehydratase